MKQHEAVISALEKMNGISTLGQLYKETMKVSDCKWETKTPFASIRRIVQTRKEIYKIKPGLYALKSYQNEIEGKGILIENNKNKNQKEILDFNHSYYQGIILYIGNMKKLKTFSPNQDKNKKFIEKPLSMIRSLNEIPKFSFTRLIERSSSIDVIWFNDREMPDSFFEIEHSTDFQNSLLKYNDLRDFYVKFYIVADKNRKSEFEKKTDYDSFKEIKQRIKFVDYDKLIAQYENMVKSNSSEFI